MDTFRFTIRKKADLVRAVERFGFVPLFRNSIPGFSVEEHVAPSAWFDGGDGVWEWKGPVIRELSCAYGKFFERKAAFVSRAWFCDLANYRRDGYDFDARYDDGLARYEDKHIYDLILGHGPISAPTLRSLTGVERGKASRFEAAMTRLQMMTYMVPCDFLFPRNAQGEKKYSYGVTVFDLSERWLGEDSVRGEYKTDPRDSLQAIIEHLREVLREVNKTDILKLIRV